MTEEQRFYCEDFTGRGIKIYPISRGKKPRVKGWPKKATIDMEQIEVWDEKFPSCNFCALAGKTSGVIIMDIDVKNDQQGLESLARLEEEHGSLDTLTIDTPSGGQHKYFQYPEHDSIKNMASIAGYPGIEIKAQNTGCVLPGSVYADGAVYKVALDADIQPLPGGLLELLKVRPVAVSAQVASARIREGTRNNTLFNLGCGYIRDGYPPEEAFAMLNGINQEYGDPPLPGEELNAIISSAVKKVEESGVSLEYAFYTDTFNSERYLLEHGDFVRYDEDQKLFYVYDGIAWKKNRRSLAMTKAKETVLRMYGLIRHIKENDARKRFASHVDDSESLTYQNNMVNMARNFPPIIIDDPRNYFDNDPYLFNCLDGTYNLLTDELQKHNPEDKITQICPLKKDGPAARTEWDTFLNTVTDGDQDLIDYLQKICGYTLSGSTGAKLWFVVYGTTDTGKSTFLNTILHVLGPDYGVMTELDTLLTRANYQIPEGLFLMKDARMVLATETGETSRHRLNIPLIKALTGGEYSVARPLYGHFQESEPKMKLFIGTNHYPEAPAGDDGFWRRMRVLPFVHKIPKDDQIPNYMRDKLLPESAGILNWMIEGFKMWNESKQLDMPECVQRAVDAYKYDMDGVAQFVDEFCVVEDGARALLKEVFYRYDNFKEESTAKLTKKKFNERMVQLGFTKHKLDEWTWKGLKLKPMRGL